jgi:hypothetical protein
MKMNKIVIFKVITGRSPNLTIYCCFNEKYFKHDEPLRILWTSQKTEVIWTATNAQNRCYSHVYEYHNSIQIYIMYIYLNTFESRT